MIIKIILALSPVLLFLLLFLILDNLRLVSRSTLFICFLWGIAVSIASFGLNTLLINKFHLNFNHFSLYVAPVIEETLKMLIILILLRRGRIGFMIDGAIYGFTVGAAFALSENLFYLTRFMHTEPNLLVWLIRGFGTAVMHGGTTAILAIIVAGSRNRRNQVLPGLMAGLVVAIFIHALFNALTEYPLWATLFAVLCIPLTVILSFHFGEREIRSWLEMEFSTEVDLLSMIRKGSFANTPAGKYLISLRNHFPPDVVVDLYCFISLYTELSVRAKSLMLLRENDFIVPPDASIQEKLQELRNLKKAIGRSGYLAISPILRMKPKDLWKLSLLEKSGKT